jgi:hypothetical protein
LELNSEFLKDTYKKLGKPATIHDFVDGVLTTDPALNRWNLSAQSSV